MLFFVSYLIFGLYFLMSFLLANVFNKFMKRLEQKYDGIYKRAEKLLKELFNRFDTNSKGYLSYNEARDFFETLLNIDLRRKQHYTALGRLLDEMEITNFDNFEC